MDAIEVKSLTFQLGDKLLFQEANLSIGKNQKVCIVGKSGSGKSSLLALLCGFHSSFKGEIHIAGLALTALNINEIRKKICWVPQANDIPQSDLTVSEYLLQPFQYKFNRGNKINEDLILNKFSQLQLEQHLLQQKFNQLSGGEKQRVLVTQALLLEREILLIDEPTSGLDKNNSASMLKVLQQLTYKTIVVATHDSLWKKKFGQNINIEFYKLLAN